MGDRERFEAKVDRSGGPNMSKDEEIASLKEALAAAKGYPDLDFPDAPPQETDRQAAVRWMRRAETAERDRDAANALLREVWEAQSPSVSLLCRVHDAVSPVQECRRCRELGSMCWLCRREGPPRREGQPQAHPLSGQPAAPARDVESRCAACDQRLDASSDRDSYHSALLASPTATDARVRELESELTDLRRSYSENTEKMILAEARVRELEAENTTLRVNNRVLEADSADLLDRRRAAESDLAALRERVAFAIAWLTDIEPKPHSKSWNALEVLRGS